MLNSESNEKERNIKTWYVRKAAERNLHVLHDITPNIQITKYILGRSLRNKIKQKFQLQAHINAMHKAKCYRYKMQYCPYVA